MQQTHTLKLARTLAAGAQSALRAQRFEFRAVDHALWQARGTDVVITWYQSGKVVVQGAQASRWLRLLETGGAAASDAPQLDLGLASPSPVRRPEPQDTRSGRRSIEVPAPDSRGLPSEWTAALRMHPVENAAAWSGADEVGKGDYFGPLVVCAVRVTPDDLPWMAALGVGDSKGLTDRAMRAMAPALRERLQVATAMLSPLEYNERWAVERNINRILDGLHAQVHSELALAEGVAFCLSDQYSPSSRIGALLAKRAPGTRFVQRTKAEADPAVAAASVLARVTFIEALAELETEIGHPLHRGAGAPTLACAHELVAAQGRGVLQRVAKLHFKTTEDVLGGSLL